MSRNIGTVCILIFTQNGRYISGQTGGFKAAIVIGCAPLFGRKSALKFEIRAQGVLSCYLLFLHQYASSLTFSHATAAQILEPDSI